MNRQDLDVIAKFISEKFKYSVSEFSETVRVMSLSDTVARVIIAIGQNPEELDVAFSPVALPSEIAAVMQQLCLLHDKITVTKDFYIGQDKELYYGFRATLKYLEDFYTLIKKKEELMKNVINDDALLDEKVFVTTKPIYAATGDKKIDRPRQKTMFFSTPFDSKKGKK
jgi:hypothetical protein